jgi:hypothetical protein
VRDYRDGLDGPAMTNEKYRSFVTGKLDIRPLATSPRESISKDLQS